MGFKQRGYKRDTPDALVRDYKLFAIACEGDKTEPKYFDVFQYLSNKIKIDVITDTSENNSAPKWVLNKAMKYIDKNGLEAEDDLWFVIDVDRWSIEQISELANYCADFPNWNICVSNPCFEVWLYLHKKENLDDLDAYSCKDLKYAIAQFEKGGYHPLKFLSNIEKAIENAQNLDKTQHFIPEEKSTKVYLLAEAILKEVRLSDLEVFIQKKLPALRLILKTNLEKKAS